jgi:hypothetical protein
VAIPGAEPVPAARSSGSPPQPAVRARPRTRAAWPRPPRPGVRTPPPRRGPRPPRAWPVRARPCRARRLSPPARSPHAGAGHARGRGGSRRDPVRTSGRLPGWPRCQYRRRCLRTRGRSQRACSSWARESPSGPTRARWILSVRSRPSQSQPGQVRSGQVRPRWSPRCLSRGLASRGPAHRGLASRGPAHRGLASAALVSRRSVATGRQARSRRGPLRLSWLLTALSRGRPGLSRSGAGAPGAAIPRAGLAPRVRRRPEPRLRPPSRRSRVSRRIPGPVPGRGRDDAGRPVA